MQSFRQRIYPTQGQEGVLKQHFGCCRFVYNWALAIRSESWTKSQKRVTSSEVGKRLTELKKRDEYSWLNDVGTRSLYFALMNLDSAFNRFFKKQAKYPTFKRKADFGGSAKFDTHSFKLVGGCIRIAGSAELIKVRWTRELPCPPKFITLSQDACGDYWVSFTCDHTPDPLPASRAKVGIDLGITSFATLSNGEKVRAPDLREKLAKVKKCQKRLSKKKKGSANRRKAKRKLARAHRRVADTRKNFHHQLSRKLVDENQVIALEDLAVSNMVKNRKLSRAISEQGWREFRSMLEYKCEWAGRHLIIVDRWFPSSKACHHCGAVIEKLPLSIRSWDCLKCGSHHDRDINAAKNILAAGSVVAACGADGRPTHTTCE